MKIENISWDHQEILTEAFRKLGLNLTEYSFVNSYLFRREHAFKVVFNDSLFLTGLTRDGHTFIMPTVRLKDLSIEEIRAVKGECEFLYPIPDEWLQDLPPEYLKSSYYLDEDSCYFYRIEKIQHYPGRNLSPKRNLVHQFLDLYDCAAYSLTQDHVQDAMQILETWQKGIKESVEESDYYPCRDALQALDRLHLMGRIYFIEGSPVGFVLGEQINAEVFDFHFVKADKSYKGIYPYLYQEFAQHLETPVKFLNFEQDLGKPNLHQSKSSYQPDKLLRKWRISLR